MPVRVQVPLRVQFPDNKGRQKQKKSGKQTIERIPVMGFFLIYSLVFIKVTLFVHLIQIIAIS